MSDTLIARLRDFQNSTDDAVEQAAAEAADRIEALQAQNIANMATCKGLIKGLQAERDSLRAEVELLTSHNQANMATCAGIIKGLQARLTALELQEPVAYLMTFSDGTTTIQKTAYWDSCVSVDGLYLAAGAAPTKEPLKAFARVSSRPIPKEQT